MKKDLKILICVPCMDQVPALFCQSLSMLTKTDNCAIAFEMSSLIYTARNHMAKAAVDMEADLTLWLDSDMVFSPDLLIRLLETMRKTGAEIVTGVYYRRRAPYTPVLFDKLEINVEDESADYSEFTDIPNDVFEVGGCGFGACLVDTGVYLDVQSKFGNCFSPIGNNGEDAAFCWRARQCGNKIVADPKIKLGHVGQAVIGADTYAAFRAAGGE